MVFANFLRGFWRFPTKFQQFKKLCCPRAEDRAIFEDLRLQGQGQGLDLRGQGQGQGLQNVSSRTSSRPRTSSKTPPLAFMFKFPPNNVSYNLSQYFTLTFDIHQLNIRSCSSNTYYLPWFKTNKLQHSMKFASEKV